MSLLRAGHKLLLCAAAWLCVCLAATAGQITDDRGARVALPKAPKRVVSLLPSLTEMVCALGRCGLLVGVDRYSNFPASLQGLPRVGGGIDPNLEAIVALKPDLVLMATSAQGIERLQALGLTVAALEPKTHADVQRVLLQMGELLQVKDARRVWRDIDDQVLAAASQVPVNLRATRVYFEVNSAPYAASESSFIGETLQRLGVNNIVPGSMGPFPKLNPEFVVRANPDLIMVGDRPDVRLEQRPGWSGMRALREQRVCDFTQEESDMLVRAGPRMAEGARLMVKCLLDKAGAKAP
jgi:iron complex transport system substrate-binding protein